MCLWWLSSSWKMLGQTVVHPAALLDVYIICVLGLGIMKSCMMYALCVPLQTCSRSIFSNGKKMQEIHKNDQICQGGLGK